MFHRRKILSMLGLILVLAASIIGGICFTYIKGKTKIKIYDFVAHKVNVIVIAVYIIRLLVC